MLHIGNGKVLAWFAIWCLCIEIYILPPPIRVNHRGQVVWIKIAFLYWVCGCGGSNALISGCMVKLCRELLKPLNDSESVSKFSLYSLKRPIVVRLVPLLDSKIWVRLTNCLFCKLLIDSARKSGNMKSSFSLASDHSLIKYKY